MAVYEIFLECYPRVLPAACSFFSAPYIFSNWLLFVLHHFFHFLLFVKYDYFLVDTRRRTMSYGVVSTLKRRRVAIIIDKFMRYLLLSEAVIRRCSIKKSRDRKKVSISILFQKDFLDWKFSPIINMRGGGGG